MMGILRRARTCWDHEGPSSHRVYRDPFEVNRIVYPECRDRIGAEIWAVSGALSSGRGTVDMVGICILEVSILSMMDSHPGSS